MCHMCRHVTQEDLTVLFTSYVGILIGVSYNDVDFDKRYQINYERALII